MHAQDQRMLPVMDLYARLSRRAAVEDKITVWASRPLSASVESPGLLVDIASQIPKLQFSSKMMRGVEVSRLCR